MLMLNNAFADSTPRRRERHAELAEPGEQTLVKPVFNDDVPHVLAGMWHSSKDGAAKRMSPEPSGVDLARTAPGAVFVQLKHMVRDTWLFAGVVPGTDTALSVPADNVLCRDPRCTPGEPWNVRTGLGGWPHTRAPGVSRVLQPLGTGSRRNP